MMPSCISSSFHLFLLLLIVPFAVSPRPLPDANNLVVKRVMPPLSGRSEIQSDLVSLSSTSTTTSTPELSADQSSGLENLPSFLRLQDTLPLVNKKRDAGTPITTFGDGLVLELSSGVATKLPTPTLPTTTTIQDTPNPPPQDAQGQTQNQHSTVAAQVDNDILTIIITSLGPPGPSSTYTVSVEAALPSSLNGVTKGVETSALPHTTALTFTSANATWVVQPFVSVFTTVDGNGSTYTTSGVFSSTSELANAKVNQSHSPTAGVGNESPSGGNPPFFSQPAAATGVIIAGVVASLAFCGLFILIRRHRRHMRTQAGLQSITSNDDYPHMSRPTVSSFSASRRHSFESDRSSTYEWHARTRAELEAMEQVGHPTVTYSAPHFPGPSTANYGTPLVVPTTYTHAQIIAAWKDSTSLFANGQVSPFADHAAVLHAPGTEPPSVTLFPPTMGVPSAYVEVQRQQRPPLLPIETGLVPLARVPALRPRSRAPVTGSPTSTPSTATGPSSARPPPPPTNARTTSAPGSPWPLPPRGNFRPLLERTPQPQSAQVLPGTTSGSRHPFTERPSSSRPSTTGEKEKHAHPADVVPQVRLSNPFADADSLSEDDDIADAHASYFHEFDLPGPGLELGFGFGPSRASIEDVLGLDERLRTYTGRADVHTITESGYKGPTGGPVVVPVLAVQAPSTEDGASLLSSEVDPMEMLQTLDEEDLFYNGGPRGFASLTALGAGRE